jgi:hypothetical protein
MNLMKPILVAAVVTLLSFPVTAQEEPAPQPTPDEGAGQVDSAGEAGTEVKTVRDALKKLKISGYLQVQYVHDETSQDELSVRRGRVKLIYQATPISRLVLQPDVTSSGVALKDGYVELTEPWTSWKHTLTAGQFNWPFGFEIGYSSSQREVAERSRVIRKLFPGERDRGVMLSGRGLNRKLTYRAAIVNGTGTTPSDDLNRRTDFVGRVGYSFGPLDLGASVYRGSELIATRSNAAGIEFDKQRQGLDVQWATPIQGLGLRAEYITGRQAPASGTTRSTSFDVRGWYFYAIKNVGTRHHFAVRVDEYDPDTNAGNNAVRTINPSYTLQWDRHSKVMASYAMTDSAGDRDDNVLTLRYQLSF